MELEKFLEEVKKQHINDGDLVKVRLRGGMFVRRLYSGIEDGSILAYREELNTNAEKYAVEKITQITRLGK